MTKEEARALRTTEIGDKIFINQFYSVGEWMKE